MPEELEDWIQKLTHSDRNVQKYAEEKLLAAGEKAVPLLVRTLGHQKNPQARSAALRLLTCMETTTEGTIALLRAIKEREKDPLVLEELENAIRSLHRKISTISMESTTRTIKRLGSRFLGGDPLIEELLISDETREKPAKSYRVIEKIGQGGMGVVYKALDVHGREVALKVTSMEQGINRFRLETVAMKLLGKHPNIPQLLDWGLEQSDVKFCVMEYISGDSLSRLIERKAEWFYADPLRQGLKLGVQILDALRHAHQHKVLHRDVKPENILVATLDHGEKVAKLTDFGVAKFLEKGFLAFLHRRITFDEKTLTLPGQPVGTLGYAPQEQLDNNRPTEAADVFSFAVTLVELLTGKPLFPARTLSEYIGMLGAFVFEPVRIPGERYLVERLNDALEKALQKNTAARYHNASKMWKELTILHAALRQR